MPSGCRSPSRRKLKGAFMVRALIVMVATLAVLLVIAPVVRLQAQNDSGASVPAHSNVAPAKGRWNDLLAKWRQNKPKLKACRAEARKKGLAGDDRWFFLENCMGRS
jgi:hypothetical protein